MSNRRAETLLVDARKLGTMLGRAHRFAREPLRCQLGTSDAGGAGDRVALPMPRPVTSRAEAPSLPSRPVSQTVILDVGSSDPCREEARKHQCCCRHFRAGPPLWSGARPSGAGRQNGARPGGRSGRWVSTRVSAHGRGGRRSKVPIWHLRRRRAEGRPE